MPLTDLTFLLVFLPAALLLNLIVPGRLRNLLLVLLGLAFYAWGEPMYVLLLLGLILLDYLLGLAVSGTKTLWLRRLWLWIGIIGNVGALLAVRLADSLRPPLGVAVYTLMAVSYLTDLYRRELPMQKNPLTCATYLTLFPLFPAGPIVSYREIAPALQQRAVTASKMADGISRFIVGLAKKVLLADGIGRLWTTISGMDTAAMPAATAWIGILAFSFRIYFDFSGYADMAVGLGRMLGFKLPKNFQYPCAAVSIREFCDRWNITLGHWFRHYVYAPLTRKGGTLRKILCTAVVSVLAGAWYGFSWGCLVWGLYLGVLLLLEEYVWGGFLEKLPRIFRWLITFLLLQIGWALFACGTQGGSLGYLSAMFGGNGAVFADTQTLYLLMTHLVLLVLCILGTSRQLTRGKAWLCKRSPRVAGGIFMLLQLALLLLCISSLAAVGSQPFILF